MAPTLGSIIDRLLLPVLLLVLGTILLLNGQEEIGFILLGTAIGVPTKQRLSSYARK